VLIDCLLRDRLGRSLEHVCNLLALNLYRGSLAIAVAALHTGDPRLRGSSTALHRCSVDPRQGAPSEFDGRGPEIGTPAAG
jgi:hypothetical protein